MQCSCLGLPDQSNGFYSHKGDGWTKIMKYHFLNFDPSSFIQYFYSMTCKKQFLFESHSLKDVSSRINLQSTFQEENENLSPKHQTDSAGIQQRLHKVITTIFITAIYLYLYSLVCHSLQVVQAFHFSPGRITDKNSNNILHFHHTSLSQSVKIVHYKIITVRPSI